MWCIFLFTPHTNTMKRKWGGGGSFRTKKPNETTHILEAQKEGGSGDGSGGVGQKYQNVEGSFGGGVQYFYNGCEWDKSNISTVSSCGGHVMLSVVRLQNNPPGNVNLSSRYLILRVPMLHVANSLNESTTYVAGINNGSGINKTVDELVACLNTQLFEACTTEPRVVFGRHAFFAIDPTYSGIFVGATDPLEFLFCRVGVNQIGLTANMKLDLVKNGTIMFWFALTPLFEVGFALERFAKNANHCPGARPFRTKEQLIGDEVGWFGESPHVFGFGSLKNDEGRGNDSSSFTPWNYASFKKRCEEDSVQPVYGEVINYPGTTSETVTKAILPVDLNDQKAAKSLPIESRTFPGFHANYLIAERSSLLCPSRYYTICSPSIAEDHVIENVNVNNCRGVLTDAIAFLFVGFDDPKEMETNWSLIDLGPNSRLLAPSLSVNPYYNRANFVFEIRDEQGVLLRETVKNRYGNGSRDIANMNIDPTDDVFSSAFCQGFGMSPADADPMPANLIDIVSNPAATNREITFQYFYGVTNGGQVWGSEKSLFAVPAPKGVEKCCLLPASKVTHFGRIFGQ